MRGSLEQLEDRRLMAIDMLVSLYDDTAGQSVLRYDYDTLAPALGGVATNDHGLNTAQGLAVAPDQSFYVSSFATGQVLHYSPQGQFIDVLGAGDAMQAPIFAPGALMFGPNGHLYLTDLGAQTVYQFDITSPTQQWQAADTLSLGYTPGGIGFSTDGDLIVGSLSTQSVTQYHADTSTTTLIGPGSGVNPSSIITKANNDLLIGDFDLGFEPMGHHRVVLYDRSENTFDTFIDISTPLGTGASAGFPSQPSSMAVDPDGNLLVGVSPDHNLNGAIQKYDIDTGASLGTLVSSIGTPTGIAFVTTASVEGRMLFYNQSGTAAPLVYDGNNPAINANDDQAIASDKSALLPGQTATFANVSSYSKGINGVMIDLAGPHGTITAADFVFRVGNNNTPSTWSAAPAPSSISVRAGAGVSGSDRITITWANGAITKQWLEVIVLANGNTLLPQKPGYPAGQGDVFFFGNAVGNTGQGDTATQATVSITDELGARNNPANIGNNIPITNIYDFNRDHVVNTTDALIARNNVTSLGNVVRYLSLTSPPAAPEAEAADNGGVASALSVPATSTSPDAPQHLAALLPSSAIEPGLVAKYLQQLAETSAVCKLLAKAGRIADLVGPDDPRLESLLDELGL